MTELIVYELATRIYPHPDAPGREDRRAVELFVGRHVFRPREPRGEDDGTIRVNADP